MEANSIILGKRSLAWKEDIGIYRYDSQADNNDGDSNDEEKTRPTKKRARLNPIITETAPTMHKSPATNSPSEYQLLFTGIAAENIHYCVEYFKIMCNMRNGIVPMYYITVYLYYYNKKVEHLIDKKFLVTILNNAVAESSEFLHHTQNALAKSIQFGILQGKSKMLNRYYAHTDMPISHTDLSNSNTINILQKKMEAFIEDRVIHYESMQMGINDHNMAIASKKIESIRDKLTHYVQTHHIKFQSLLMRLKKSTLLSEFIKLEEDMIKFVKNKIEEAKAEAEAKERQLMTLNDIHTV